MASRQHGCSFILTNSSSGKRCQPSDSLAMSSAQIDNDKDCPENCVSTKYSLSLTQSDLSDSVKKYLSEKITSGKENFKWIKQYWHFLKMNQIVNFVRIYYQFIKIKMYPIILFLISIFSLNHRQCSSISDKAWDVWV